MRAYQRFLPLAVAAALTVSGAVAANGTTTANPLADTSWQLVSLGGEAVAEGVVTTLIIGAEGTIGGNGGCNSYGGSIEFSGDDEIAISEVFSTMMYCGDTQMAQEGGYFTALETAVSYSLDGDTLVLINAEGNALATLAAGAEDMAAAPDEDAVPLDLAGTQWRATSLAGTPTADDVDSTVIFRHDGSVGGHSGCNGYGGQASVSSDGTIAFSDIVTTQIGCMGPAGSQERALYTAFESAASYRADSETLTLSDADGTVLAQFIATSE